MEIDETLSEEVELASADGEVESSEGADNTGEIEEVSKEAAKTAEEMAEGLSLKELEDTLGKKFKTKEAALKAVKDTFNYVGKEGKVDSKELYDQLQNTQSEIESLNKDTFFDKNPQYAPYKDVIEQLGGDPKEVIESEGFKSIFEKASEFDKIQSKKSVLESNSRLGQVSDKMTKARQSIEKGDVTIAENDAVGAVIDAYEL